MQPPHGGQIAATRWHYFEVVYLPRETRVYVYSPSQRPLNAQNVRGHVAMQVNGNPQVFRYPLQAVADGSGLAYLKAEVDVTRVRDGDMQTTFEVSDLPNRVEPAVRFTQTFALTQPPLPVQVVPLGEADRPLVTLQKTCPVMDAALDDHGAPIKLLVGDQPVYVCCEACIVEVQRNPHRYLAKAVAARQAAQQRPANPPVAVVYATSADDDAIRTQAICPVTSQALGAHGPPIKVAVQGRSLFVCCRGCIDAVLQQPEAYFRQTAIQRIETSPPTVVEQSPPAPRFSVAETTAADEPAIRAQERCPVMNRPLGSHGRPIKLLVDGQPLFVCCKGCISRIQNNPELYLAKIRRQ